MDTRMTNQQAITFIMAGRAKFTIKSLKTEKHYTYRVTRKKGEELWFVSNIYKANDEENKKYIGVITKKNEFKSTRASKVKKTSMSFIAFQWVWRQLMMGNMPENLEIWHAGCCGRCGRELTDPTSIQSGFGPECRKFI